MPSALEEAPDREDRDQPDELAADDNAHDVDGRLPGDLTVLHDVDADRPRVDAEPHAAAGAGALLAVGPALTLAAAAASAAADHRHGDDGDVVDPIGLA